MVYQIRPTDSSTPLTSDWDAPPWRDQPAADISHFMGGRPAFIPRVQARLLYEPDALRLLFRVEDRYVRAVAPDHDGQVWKDSCVELFFSPGELAEAGYFNFEINCGGTMLLHHQLRSIKLTRHVTNEELGQIQVLTTMPRLIDEEMTEPVTWTLACRIPLELLARYCPAMRRPGPGVAWRGNFYKCAENNSNPHWLTWAPVDFPRPNFHLPEFFGKLQFL